MTRCGIEVTSNDPGLLQFLITYPATPSWSVIDVEGKYYLISPDFLKLADPQEVRQAADNLLFVINGILKFKLKSPGIVGEGTIAYFDEKNQFIRGAELRIIYNVSASLSVSESYYRDADARQPSIVDIWHKAQQNELVEEALQHYSNPLNWFNLYKVYELIEKDVGKKTLDGWAKGRREDFTYSANNGHASGFAARHSSKAFAPSAKRRAMSLQEGGDFISDLLSQWLQTK